jgi:hypothetical protein
MTEEAEAKPDPNQAFNDKAIRSLSGLFEKAKAANELHFMMALMPEFRGMQDGGWNTGEEALRAFDQYSAHIKSLPKDDPVRVRIAMAFYLHACECSGFYEIPKKMMLTVEGKGNNIWPFQPLVKKHMKTGTAIDPNANTIMKNMMGHAYDLQLFELSEVFKEAFDPDLRNAIAHADYILANDGVRIRRRNGGQPRVVSWQEFDELFRKGIALFDFVRQIAEQSILRYDPPKTIKARLNVNEPLTDYTLYFVPATSAYGFTTGQQPPAAAHPAA